MILILGTAAVTAFGRGRAAAGGGGEIFLVQNVAGETALRDTTDILGRGRVAACGGGAADLSRQGFSEVDSCCFVPACRPGSGMAFGGTEYVPVVTDPRILSRAAGSPLSVSAAFRSNTRGDVGVGSTLQAGSRWSTGINGSVSGNFTSFDGNSDGFMDDSRMLHFSLGNSWMHTSSSGVRIRFGVGGMYDRQKSGQSGYNYDDYYAMVAGANSLIGYNSASYRPLNALNTLGGTSALLRTKASNVGTGSSDWLPWGAEISLGSVGAFLNAVIPLTDNSLQNLSVDADYTYINTDSYFGATKYLVSRHRAGLNLQYNYDITSRHRFHAGLGADYDRYGQTLRRTLADLTQQGIDTPTDSDLSRVGILAGYTYTTEDKFSAGAEIGASWYNAAGGKPQVKFVPKAFVKYAPDEHIIMQVSGGRALRYASPLEDNIGVLSTGKTFMGDYLTPVLEDAWILAGSLTYRFRIGASEENFFRFEYNTTRYSNQLVADYEYLYAGSSIAAGSNATAIDFYATDGRRSFTDIYRLELFLEPVRGFTVDATFRYTNDKIKLLGKEYLVDRPLSSRYRGALNLQYATARSGWIFDLTASVNGPSRVYNFMEDDEDEYGNLIYVNGRTPVYPLLDFEVVKRFKTVDVFIGGENLTNYRQKYVVLGNSTGADGHVDGNDLSFDASAVWGPVSGIKVFAGVRYNLSKH